MANCNSKRKKIVLKLEQKLSILDSLEQGESQTSLAIKYNVGNSTISETKKNKIKIREFAEKVKATDGNLQKRKSMKRPANSDLDSILFEWFCQKRTVSFPISGPILKEKANLINSKINGDPNFKSSEGWLAKFKERHEIRQLYLSGEKQSADKLAGEKFVQEFKTIVSDPNLCKGNIWNMDESGLEWKSLPRKSLASQRESVAPGPKAKKERVTLLFCSNASGTSRMKLMVIGKSRVPRCFKTKDGPLPVIYRSQESSWMNLRICKNWFFDDFLPAARQHNAENGLPDYGLLILDNASVHPPAEELCSDDGHYRAVFLPPNVTSIIQPLDQSVIETFKRYYKKFLLTKFLMEDTGEEDFIKTFYKNFTLLDAIRLAVRAWDTVKEETLKRAWNKLRPSPEPEEVLEEQVTASSLLEMVQDNPGFSNCTEEDITYWLNSDSEDPGYRMLDDDELIARYQGCNEGGYESDSSTIFEENDPVLESVTDFLNIPTHDEALQSLDTLLQWLPYQLEVQRADIDNFKRIRSLAAQKSLIPNV